MNLIVLIKSVQDGKYPDYGRNNFRITRNKENTIMDIDSGNMLETAVRYKEKNHTKTNIIALCMGNKDSEDVLIQALAVGADEAVHINDTDMEGSDTIVTAKVLATASGKLNGDLILCGNMSQDGRTGNTGVMIAEYLKVPVHQNICDFHIKDCTVTAVSVEDNIEKTTISKIPAVLIGRKQKNILRNITMTDLVSALDKEVKIMTGDDLGFRKEDLESNTEVLKVFERHKQRKQIILGFDEDVDISGFISQIKKSASEFL